MPRDPEVSTVVTQREDTVPHDTLATTPASTPANVKVLVMTPLLIVVVRAARVYLQVVIGLLSAAGLGADGGMLPSAFGPLVWSVLQLALAPALMSVLTNSAELLGRVDVHYPRVRA